MDIELYISKQPSARQNILTKIHKIIVESDRSVKAEVGLMMGKEMILYKGKGIDEIWPFKRKKLYVASRNADIWFKGSLRQIQGRVTQSKFSERVYQFLQ